MNLPAPPGIEFVYYLFLAGFMLVASAIAYYIARLLKKLLKVKIGPVEIIIIATLFLLSFSASSTLLRQKKEGVTIHLYGHLTGYEGTLLCYGFPSIMFEKFEPYDPSFNHLFTRPTGPDFGASS